MGKLIIDTLYEDALMSPGRSRKPPVENKHLLNKMEVTAVRHI